MSWSPTARRVWPLRCCAALLALLLAAGAGARAREHSFAVGPEGRRFFVGPRGRHTVEVHLVDVPPKATAFAAVVERIARVPQWGALAGGGAFIGNETGRGDDDASPAGLRIGPEGRQEQVAAFGVELCARTRAEERVFAARDCLGGRCTLRSGPRLTAQLLTHWRETGTRPPVLGLDVDGTLVERYLPGESGFVHATLDGYPELARELVALARDRYPFFFLTRSALDSVRTRVLDPLDVALAQAGVNEPLPTWVVSSSLTVLDEVRWRGSAAGTGSLQVLQDPAFGQGYRILPAELDPILRVLGATAMDGLLAEAHSRAMRWEQDLIDGPAKWPRRALARFGALLGGGLGGLSPKSPQLVPVVELRPGRDAPSVVSINPIAAGFRDTFAARLVRTVEGGRSPRARR